MRPKTASTNSPWAYIREGLLSEGFLRLRFGGLIFGRAYYREFYGMKINLTSIRVKISVTSYPLSSLPSLIAERT